MNGQSSLLRHMLRSFSVSVALRVTRLVVSLVITSFLARYIGQEGFGQLMVALAVVSVLLCISELGLQSITTRELVENEDGQWGTIGTTFFTRVITGAFIYAGLLLYVLVAAPSHWLLLVIYGSLLVTHAGTEIITWLVARHHLRQAAWTQLGGFLVSAVFIAVGIYFQAPVWYFACTYVLECWLTLALTLIVFRRCGGRLRLWRWSRARALGLLGESWYELVSQLALLLLLRMDTIMVEALRGAEEAGIYGAAVRVSEVVYFIPIILAGTCLPSLIALRGRDPIRYRERFADYFALSLVLSVPFAGVLTMAAPYIVAVLFGTEFNASTPILMTHVWAFIPYALGIARTGYLTAEGRLWVNLPSVVIALGLNALLNWLWIPTYGGLGAAWATFIAYSVAWVGSSLVLPDARDSARLMWLGLVRLPSLLTHFRSWRLSDVGKEPPAKVPASYTS